VVVGVAEVEEVIQAVVCVHQGGRTSDDEDHDLVTVSHHGLVVAEEDEVSHHGLVVAVADVVSHQGLVVVAGEDQDVVSHHGLVAAVEEVYHHLVSEAAVVVGTSHQFVEDVERVCLTSSLALDTMARQAMKMMSDLLLILV